MDELLLARALHVLGVVIWIGGVAMATTVVIPAAQRGELGPDRFKAFEAIERRFAWLARGSIVLVGLTGFYMVAELDLWERFLSVEFWWMHAMLCLWLFFTLVLFVAEPLVLHRWVREWAAADPQAAMARLERAHWVLLLLGLITIFGTVAGSHGWSWP